MNTLEDNVSPSLVTITNVVYGLQALGLLTPLFPVVFIVAVIINYVKQDDVQRGFLASHFRWQIRTFWFGLLWVVVGGLTAVVLVGFAILAVAWIWMIYRVIKGWLDLMDRKPMYRNQM